MNDKDLADKVVDLGIGEIVSHWNSNDYTFDTYDNSTTADQFVRDWRVAGSLMERAANQDILIWQQQYPDLAGMKVQPVWIVEISKNLADARDESLPRAIIEACVEALSND